MQPAATPDFWGFLQHFDDRVGRDFSQVMSEAELQAMLSKWLDPKSGILARVKDDPFWALARPSAQKVFMELIKDRIRLAEKYQREVWGLLELS